MANTSRAKTHDIRVRVAEVEFEELKKLAEQKGMTVAELMRHATRIMREKAQAG